MSEQPEPLEADGTPVDHEPLERAEEAIDDAKSAASDVERTGGTFGGDVIEDDTEDGSREDGPRED